MLNRAQIFDQVVDDDSHTLARFFVDDPFADPAAVVAGDALDRLTPGEGVYGTRDYAYDPTGNRLERTADTAGSGSQSR